MRMTRREQLDAIKARRAWRRQMLAILPAWMERARAYLEAREKADKALAHLIRCGVMRR